MSLFVSQQNMPFASVVKYLRYFAPATEMPPEQWADIHSHQINIGDVVFVLDPVFSPWGDSSTGIGVADGDSFKVGQVLFAFNVDAAGLQAYSVTADVYEMIALKTFFEDQARNAKEQGTGFYYAIVRPIATLSPDHMHLLSELNKYGASGWRNSESGLPDLPSAFFETAGFPVESKPGLVLDASCLGYLLFCDKDPPTGSGIPELRPFLLPVPMEEGSLPEHTAPSAEPHQAPAAETPNPSASHTGMPKLPSFFSQMKPGVQTKTEPTGTRPPAPPQIKLPQPPKRPGPTPMPPGTRGLPPPIPSTHLSEPVGDSAASIPMMPVPGMEGRERLAQKAPESPINLQTIFDESQAETVTHLQAYTGHLDPQPAPHVSPPVPEPVQQLAQPSQDAQPATSQPSSGPVPPPVPVRIGPKGVVPPLPPSMGTTKADAVKTTRSSSVPAPHQVSPARSGTVPPMPGSPIAEPAVTHSPAVEAPPHSLEADGAHASASVSSETASGADLVASPSEPAAAEHAAEQHAVEQHAVEQHAAITEPATPAEPALPDLVSLLEAATATKPGPAFEAEQEPEPPFAAHMVVEEPPAVVPPANPISSTMPGMTVRKKKVDAIDPARAQELESRAAMKEPAPVKSGVAGLVSKLEQQAAKASTRLESQVEEIQNQLNEELNRLMGKVSAGEKRSAKSSEGLRINLTSKMEGATDEVKNGISDATSTGSDEVRRHLQSGIDSLDEKHEYLRASLADSFDEVRTRSETIAKGFEESLGAQSNQAQADVKELRQSLSTQFDQVQEHYEQSLQSTFDSFKERTESANQSIISAIETRYAFLQSELADLQNRSTGLLDQTKQQLLNRLIKQFQVAEAELTKLQASLLSDNIMPRLKQHREELRVVTSEFQRKLTEDLEAKGETKVTEFDPVLQEKKQKLSELLLETTTIKDAMQEQLRTRLEEICQALNLFVDENIEQAKNAYRSTEDQLTEIDRAVRALADPSSIEGDTELRSERNEVLDSIDRSTEKCKDDVLNTLRASVASLEEKGKQLQEELISSMEEDAYAVRRASEQALVQIKEELRTSFVAIQTAQDERMPM